MELFKEYLNWEKRGLLLKPDPSFWWWQTHVMTPTIQKVDNNKFLLYFSGRDSLNRSQIGCATITVDSDNLSVESIFSEPVLQNGELGCFDDNGVTPSSIVTHNNQTYLYYIGWNPGSTVRMHIYGGLALSDAKSPEFSRYSKAPVIERCRINPYINTSPFVLKDGHLWRMYFVAGTEWVHKDLPRYNIQYAESSDGKVWNQTGHVCIDFASDQENALARPYVIKAKDSYRMWFCHKGNEYRFGYAESTDGINWIRNDNYAGLDVSDSGWDNQMIAYPCVFESDKYAFMLYNGNNYGSESLGWAVARK